MELVAICDLFMKPEFILRGLAPLSQFGINIRTVEWNIGDIPKLQETNLAVEKSGSEIIEPTTEVMTEIANADIIVTHFCTITKKVIDSCPKLKIICVLRGGVENINVNYATEKNILCINTPGRTSNAVADFTIGMVLAETRNIARSHLNLKQGRWIREYDNKNRVPNMFGHTFGIIGLGEIGQKIAQRLSGFEMKILGFDPYVTQDEISHLNIEKVDLDDLLRQSDIVSINARLVKETYHMIGARELSLMKKTAYLINTARSGLVDERALYEVLKLKKITGAAIDVFDIEPTPTEYPIISLDNVTITPHLAGGTIDTMNDSPRLLANNLCAFLSNGSNPRGGINMKNISFKIPLNTN